jgi:hypothetical protein
VRAHHFIFRASQLLKTFADTQTVQESHSLSMFLATQNKIRDNLKTELIAIDGYEELLTDIVNICVFLFESKMYLSPKEKHLLVKVGRARFAHVDIRAQVMAFGLYLIDSAQEPHLARLDQKKRINIPKIDRIFKVWRTACVYIHPRRRSKLCHSLPTCKSRRSHWYAAPNTMNRRDGRSRTSASRTRAR